MKKYLFVGAIFCFLLSVEAQNTKGYHLIRSNLGTGGLSKTVSIDGGKYSISQSIGQSSVIGTSYNNGYYLRQGYQQPLNKSLVIKESANNNLQATVLPNPFEQTVSISFTDTIESDVSILVFDITGKLVYSKEFPAQQNIELDLGNISNGTYLLKTYTKGKSFNAKLIKI